MMRLIEFSLAACARMRAADTADRFHLFETRMTI